VPGFEFLTQHVDHFAGNPYIIWILGSLFLFVSALGVIIVRMALLMFQWRREIDNERTVNAREIDKKQTANAIAIASLATLKPDIERNANDIRSVNIRMTKMIERRLGMKDRDEDDF